MLFDYLFLMRSRQQESASDFYFRTICILFIAYKTDPFSPVKRYRTWEIPVSLMIEYRNLMCRTGPVPFFLCEKYPPILLSGQHRWLAIAMYILWCMYIYNLDPSIYYLQFPESPCIYHVLEVPLKYPYRRSIIHGALTPHSVYISSYVRKRTLFCSILA